MEKKSINRLTSLQVFQLYKYLQDNEPTWLPGVTLALIAESAKSSLSFNVNEANVQDALRQLHIKLPAGGSTSDARRIAILRLAIEQMYRNLGQGLPAEWSNF
jgi:hypothetical protein